MKKIIVVSVALALFASPAFASIVNGKHDLSAKNVSASSGSAATDEVCVFCHTPHAAQAAWGTAIPLQNRTTTGSDFCMSCHDGSVQYNDISNPSNADAGTSGTGTYNFAGAANFGATYGTSNHPVGSDAVFQQGLNGMKAAAPTALIANNAQVTCSSCHDVHEPAGAPFLKMDNSGSNLCLACHEK